MSQTSRIDKEKEKEFLRIAIPAVLESLVTVIIANIDTNRTGRLFQISREKP